MNALLKEAIASGQDFEWYPTTDEIIAGVVSDLCAFLPKRTTYESTRLSVLDVGAGDGRVLKRIADALHDQSNHFTADLLAIEKSIPLYQSLPDDVGIVGTDFFAQSLTDKEVDVVFSNPPYSLFEEWMVKLISEANALLAYLVVPQRWTKSYMVQQAIEARQADAKVIGQFDFSEGERKARAKVDVVRLSFIGRSYLSSWMSRSLYDKSGPGKKRDALARDPFSLWFDSHFSQPSSKEKCEEKQGLSQRIDQEKTLIPGATLVEALESLYQQDLSKLLETYRHLMSLDAGLMAELQVTFEGAKAALRSRISGLKQLYWQELFGRLDTLTKRLTSSTRKKMLEILRSRTQVDYTAGNAYAIVVWACKNANRYYDEQIVDVFEYLMHRCDVVVYRSNEKLLHDQNWRYQSAGRFDNCPVKLEYRLIVSLYRAFDDYSGLSRSAKDLLDDLVVLGSNFGFEPITWSNDCSWKPGVPVFFQCEYRGSEQTLMRVKAHKNGNVHIQFHPDFILRLNVEAGRLKGWIGNPYEAAEEFNLSEEEAKEVFGSNFQIAPSKLSGLLAKL